MTYKKGKVSISKNDSKRLWEIEFKKLYEDYFDRLYAYAKVICNSSEMAQDVVADFFYLLWKSKTDFNEINDVKAYIFVSVKNSAVQALLQERKLVNHEFIEVRQRSIEYLNPEHLLLEKELKSTLNKSVDKLPEQCQLVFRMAKEQGLKYQEIAAELNISTETVKSQLARAQKQLRADIIRFYKEKDHNNFPDIRLIGQFLLLMGI